MVRLMVAGPVSGDVVVVGRVGEGGGPPRRAVEVQPTVGTRPGVRVHGLGRVTYSGPGGE